MEYIGQSRSAKLHQRLIGLLASPSKWPSSAVSVPARQAHRGYWLGGKQENTLGAFIAAKDQGSEMIELDVRLTRDQQVVVFHDQDLQRLAGSEIRVEQLTYPELLQKLPLVPLLAQVLTHPGVPQKVNIELKTDKLIDDPLERKAWQVVQSCRAQGRVLFSSFNPFSLWRLSLHTSEVPLALLVSGDLVQQSLRELWLLPLLKIHVLHVEQNMATDEFLEFWQSKGFPISVWTVNDPQKITELLERGCLSVISDLVS